MSADGVRLLDGRYTDIIPYVGGDSSEEGKKITGPEAEMIRQEVVQLLRSAALLPEAKQALSQWIDGVMKAPNGADMDAVFTTGGHNDWAKLQVVALSIEQKLERLRARVVGEQSWPADLAKLGRLQKQLVAFAQRCGERTHAIADKKRYLILPSASHALNTVVRRLAASGDAAQLASADVVVAYNYARAVFLECALSEPLHRRVQAHVRAAAKTPTTEDLEQAQVATVRWLTAAKGAAEASDEELFRVRAAAQGLQGMLKPLLVVANKQVSASLGTASEGKARDIALRLERLNFHMGRVLEAAIVTDVPPPGGSLRMRECLEWVLAAAIGDVKPGASPTPPKPGLCGVATSQSSSTPPRVINLDDESPAPGGK